MISLPTFASDRARRIWVKSQLEMLGSSFAAIGREHGWTPNAVSKAMVMPSDAAERAIATKLGVAQHMLFPERFHAVTGERLHTIRKSIDQHPIHNANRGEAA